MIPKVLVNFDASDVPGGAQAVLGPAGIDLASVEIVDFTMYRRIHHVWVTLTLAQDDERLPRLLDLLRQHGLTWNENHFESYTDEELDDARLLVLKPNCKCEVRGGSDFGTTYDLQGACPSCGAGARQTSAMFLDGWDDEVYRKLKGHRAAQTLRDELLVDDRIAAEIEALAPTGLVLHQVYAVDRDTKRQVKLAYKQLSADRVLPPMAPLSNLIHGFAPLPTCRLCTRSHYLRGSPPHVFYRNRDLEGAGDVNLSWEGLYAGDVKPNPLECRIPVPMVLVTPKVMRVFRDAGVTEFDWIPIRVVDE